jgi:hypothetical protein
MPLRLVSPVARSSAMIGAKSAAIRLARAERALSAMLGPRWRAATAWHRGSDLVRTPDRAHSFSSNEFQSNIVLGGCLSLLRHCAQIFEYKISR